ncbi:MAG: group II intron reverse transcriptase/maturase [Spirochaetes bacterium]|nr:group II intron reverse transcriptase/maturase [Spirochaetota bacterium]
MKSIIKEKVSTKQKQIALNAKRLPDVSFTSIAYHMDLGWLYEAYRQTRKDGAVGVDGITAGEYEKNLKENLSNLLDRAKSGRYKASPVRRVYIPKGNGKELRPLGIPTFEDKILQRAVKMLIEPIYEQDFYNCSYGFRPNKSQHGALQKFWEEAMGTKGWVIDLDMRKYFDSINHKKLMEILKQRVNDGVIIRLIGKWLNAGIMEEKNLHYNETGTPQGGVISPLLSNIYLHEVMDKWFINEVKPRMKGRVYMVRFADDAVMGFRYEKDAERVMKVLPKRLEKYGLKLNLEKTKVVKFRIPLNKDDDIGTINFLGFTHYWGKSRRGNNVIMKKTEKKRFARALKEINEWCKKNRHLKMKVQCEKLRKKIQGHYGYYGITPNGRAITIFFHSVGRIWFKWVNRRGRKDSLNWEKFTFLLKNVYQLPKPRIVHSVYSAKL